MIPSRKKNVKHKILLYIVCGLTLMGLIYKTGPGGAIHPVQRGGYSCNSVLLKKIHIGISVQKKKILWAHLYVGKFPGQGLNPSCTCDLCCSCCTSGAFRPLGPWAKLLHSDSFFFFFVFCLFLGPDP